MTALIGFLFLLSGAIGLGYEIVWIKILALHFGNSAWSISAVVAAFMAGLGVGSWWAGRKIRRIQNPLRVYAWLELCIAAFGVLSIPVFENVDRLLGPLYLALENHFYVFVFVRLIFAFVILIVPTFLMGASLPVLIAALIKKNDFDRTVGFLYGINTVGAALGVYLTGFFLLPFLGIRATLYVLVIGGILVGALAWGFSRQSQETGTTRESQHEESAPRIPILFYVAALSGGAIGIFFEIAWARLLAPIVGSSTYAFSIILTTFLIGIGLGGLIVSRGGLSRKSAQSYIGIFISTAALATVLGLFLVNHLPDMFLRLARASGRHMAVFFLFQGVLAGTLMLLPTLCLGIVLPLCMVSQDYVGRIYAANTIGSILGSLLAGFVFLPLVGVRNSIVIIAATGICIGLVLIYLDKRVSLRWKRSVLGFIGLFLAVIIFLNPTVDSAYLQQGFFRRVLSSEAPSDKIGPTKPYLLFTRDGITSTVAVYRVSGGTWLTVNGKADASTLGDMGTQYLLGHLPLAFSPQAKKVCVIGFGSGATVNAIAGHAIEQIDVVELEPAVLETAGYFASVNDNILTDPRVRVHVEDGRTFLKYRQEVYDFIISEPSNPWIVGVGSLFTTEFYRSVKKRLAPGGVFCQWIQNYEMSDETRGTMLSTLAAEFNHVQLFSNRGDLICIATNHPVQIDREAVAKMFKNPGFRRTAARLDIENPYDLFVGYLSSFPENFEPYQSHQRNTDDNHWLEFHAPFEMYQGLSPTAHLLPPAVYIEQFQKIFFPNESKDRIVLGLAGAIHKLRPYARSRIESMQTVVSSAETKRALAQLLVNTEKRWKLYENVQADVQQAALLYGERKNKEALALLAKYRGEKIRDSGLYRIQADALFALKQIDQSIELFHKAIQLQPDDYLSYTGLGVAYMAKNNLDGAAKYLRAAVELNPYYALARINAGLLLLQTKRFSELEHFTAISKKILSPDQFAEYQRVVVR